jgi:NAD+ synthase (glutamine-hydrolysing)
VSSRLTCILSSLQLVVKAVAAGDALVLADARRIGKYGDAETVTDPQELASRLFTTVYMGSANSSKETRDRCVVCCAFSQVGVLCVLFTRRGG